MIATTVEIEFLPGNLSSSCFDHVDSNHLTNMMMGDDSSCVSASNHSFSSNHSKFSVFRPSKGFFHRQTDDDDLSDFGGEEIPPNMSEADDPCYSSQHQRRGTFVRFASDEKGRLLTECFHYKTYGRAERKSIWYRGRDFKSFAKRAQTKAQNTGDYLKMVADLRTMCQSGDKLRKRAEILQHFCLCVAESPFRGLEPFLGGTQERRKQVIHSVLDEQDQWLALGSMLTEEERILALGDHCRTMTKSHRRIAHLMAMGDSMMTKRGKGVGAQRSNDDPGVISLDKLEI